MNRTLAKYLSAAFVVLFFLTPIVWTLITAIKPTELITSPNPVWIFQPTLEHFRNIFSGGNILKPLLNSTLVATACTLVVISIAAPAAYALSRLRAANQ